MENTKDFKHTLPDDCPASFINSKNIKEGNYGVQYYRISKESPPREEDFTPQFFLARYRKKVDAMKKQGNNPALCQMSGASILKKEDDAIRLIKKFKRMGNYIFCGIITKNDGLILVSPSRDSPSHCSFFVYSDVDESRIFGKGIYP